MFKNIFIGVKACVLFGLLIKALLLPAVSFATEGSCSSHGGANCSIGAINNQAVCNDGWLSSVPYSSMNECIGWSSSCVSYLNETQYLRNKNAIKDQMATVQTKVDQLKSDLSALSTQELKAILDLQESFAGRGVTIGGVQPLENSIHADYAKKRLDVSQQYEAVVAQYNSLVKDYNGICRNYTYEEKNNVCLKNFGSDYKFSGGYCSAPQRVASEPVSSYSSYANVNNRKIYRDVRVGYEYNYELRCDTLGFFGEDLAMCRAYAVDNNKDQWTTIDRVEQTTTARFLIEQQAKIAETVMPPSGVNTSRTDSVKQVLPKVEDVRVHTLAQIKNNVVAAPMPIKGDLRVPTASSSVQRQEIATSSASEDMSKGEVGKQVPQKHDLIGSFKSFFRRFKFW